jgi:hypothetical protein
VNGTLQDWLAKALRCANIADLETANRFLDNDFLVEFNASFEVSADEAEDWNRALSARMDRVDSGIASGGQGLDVAMTESRDEIAA